MIVSKKFQVYFAYFFTFNPEATRLNCESIYESEREEVARAFFCLIGQSTINWIIKFLYLSIFGSLFGASIP
jgi:hypothetical protein